MKKLFKVEAKYIVLYQEETEIFEILDYETHSSYYLNKCGEKVEPIKNDSVESHEVDEYPTDPTIVGCEVNEAGSYFFTTQAYKSDVDGYFGKFGIKDKYGKILVPERYYSFEFSNFGTFTVCDKKEEWGLLDSNGKEILPCMYYDPIYFNKYGISYGNACLIDLFGNEILDTKNNFYTRLGEDQRYISFDFSTEEELKYMNAHCGQMTSSRQSVFDSKERKVILRDIPEEIDFASYTGEPELIKEAVKLVPGTERVFIENGGIIMVHFTDHIDVYDFYDGND